MTPDIVPTRFEHQFSSYMAEHQTKLDRDSQTAGQMGTMHRSMPH